MFCPVSQITAVRWQCPKCQAAIEVALNQTLKNYSSQGNWHCPVCQEGTSEIRDALNYVIATLNQVNLKEHSISFVFDAE